MICQTFVYPSNHIKCFLNHKNQTILLYKLNEIFVNLKNKNIQILKKKSKKMCHIYLCIAFKTLTNQELITSNHIYKSSFIGYLCHKIKKFICILIFIFFYFVLSSSSLQRNNLQQWLFACMLSIMKLIFSKL